MHFLFIDIILIISYAYFIKMAAWKKIILKVQKRTNIFCAEILNRLSKKYQLQIIIMNLKLKVTWIKN